MFKKILVPIDGSNSAKASLKEAMMLGERFGSELIVFTVVPELAVFEEYPTNYPFSEDIIKANTKRAEQLLEQVKSEMVYDGEIITCYETGAPATEIVNYAEEHDVDLIVIGNRGLGAFSRTLLGSVSNKVINHAHTNVLVVKSKNEENN